MESERENEARVEKENTSDDKGGKTYVGTEEDRQSHDEENWGGQEQQHNRTQDAYSDLTSEEKRTYDRLRAKVKGAFSSKVPPKYQKAVEVCLFLPDFVVLIFRLLKDSRVPLEAKAKLALFTAYLASPIDIVPDFIPVVGQLDDLVGAVFVIRGIMGSTPKEVVEENWSGEGEILEVAKKVLDVAGEVFGSGALKKILTYFGKSNR